MRKGPSYTKYLNTAVDLTEWRLRALSIGMVVVYLVSLFLHHEHVGESQHFHGEAAEQCHDHASVDPCHQAIYHAGLSDCEHDVHLFESIASCEVCDLLLTKIRDHKHDHENEIAVFISSVFIPVEMPIPALPAEGSAMLRAPPGA